MHHMLFPIRYRNDFPLDCSLKVANFSEINGRGLIHISVHLRYYEISGTVLNMFLFQFYCNVI